MLIGPVVLPAGLNADNYLQFIIDGLPGLLEDVPLNVRLNLWFQMDGAPPHFGIAVRNWVTVNYLRWIGGGGPVAWPPRSPDHNPLDLYLWGYMKDLVYAQVVNTRE